MSISNTVRSLTTYYYYYDLLIELLVLERLERLDRFTAVDIHQLTRLQAVNRSDGCVSSGSIPPFPLELFPCGGLFQEATA